MTHIVKFVLIVVISCVSLSTFLAQNQTSSIESDYRAFFEEAYELNENLPQGILEAISYNLTRIYHHIPTSEDGSCIGMPHSVGVMGLYTDGKGHFGHTVELVSKSSGYSVEQIINSPRYNILATANYLSELAYSQRVNEDKLGQWKPFISKVAGLPDYTTVVDDYVNDMFAWQVLESMKNGINLNAINYLEANPSLDVDKLFEKEMLILFRAQQVEINIKKSSVSADYPPALWDPAASCNYSNGRSNTITDVVCHIMEGFYAGSISWFKDCQSNVSAHYLVRSSDGQITQMVLESNTAQHVAGHNSYTIGIEHEGFDDNPNWYTTQMYTASATLTADICVSHGINPLTAYSGTSQAELWTTSHKILGHTHYPTTKPCPGIYWNYALYYDLLNGAACLQNQTITTNSTGIIQVSDYILSSGGVAAGNSVVYDAGNYVDLVPGFEGQAGSVFDGKIGGCQ